MDPTLVVRWSSALLWRDQSTVPTAARRCVRHGHGLRPLWTPEVLPRVHVGDSAMTLAEFLLARIAEDARWADEIHREGCDHLPPQPTFPCDCEWPARLLAECEAKRRIVEECDAANRLLALTGNPTDSFRDWLLRDLALPYADHEQFQESWRV